MQYHEVADVQSRADNRNIPINRVGVRQIRHPLTFEGQATIGQWDMTVNLPKDAKGTHMSRFLEILNEKAIQLSLDTVPQLLTTMVQKLQAQSGYLNIQFPYFIQKSAPISKAKGLMDYDINLQAQIEKGTAQTHLTVVIPVTSLCPCSKQISEAGAHNQRSHITLTIKPLPQFKLGNLIQAVEKLASCDLYSILKRQDEKYVTEKAYDNPKFVEDMVRDIAALLESWTDINGYKVSSENFESIHNHSAYAEIDKLLITSPQPQTKAQTEAEIA